MTGLWKRSWGFFACLMILLSFRAASDHQFNFHYTGDNTSEQMVELAARNFKHFGFMATRFTPLFEDLPMDTPVDLRSPSRSYYTHYGPLPYLLFSLPFTLLEDGEFVARLIAILISLLGIWFALAAVYEWTGAFVSSEAVPILIPLAFLALTPVLLCFGDTIHEQSVTEALKWAGLLWAVRSLRQSTEKPYSLLPGIAVSFLLIYVSFDWLLPMAAAMIYVLWTTRGSPHQSPRVWGGVIFLACVLPIGLRWAQILWVLGGWGPALQDWGHILQLRAEGSQTLPYSVIRHIVKLLVGVLWFTGPIVPLAVGLSGRHLASKMAETGRHSLVARRLMVLLGIWGIGSISWQFLMRQHAMIHGFTFMHPANFLILMAAVGIILLWTEKQTTLVSLLVAGQVFWGGILTHSEILIPFVRTQVIQHASRLCPPQAERLRTEADKVHSSIASDISKALSQTPQTTACRSEGERSALLLRLFLYTVKNSTL